jgi:nitroreductase
MKINEREVNHKVSEIFPKRWSPRAFVGDKISEEDFSIIFEAARWAPSSYNEQPWLFYYVTREDKDWQIMLDTLIDFNKSWAKEAYALIFIASRKSYSKNDKPNQAHGFDTGSAWMSLALQASMLGLVTHPMGGFDKEKVKEILSLSDDVSVHAAVAIGHIGDSSNLTKELEEMEKKSDRKNIEEFAFRIKL